MTTEQIEKIVTELGFSIEEKRPDNTWLTFNHNNECMDVIIAKDFVSFIYTRCAYIVNNKAQLTMMQMIYPTQDKLKVAAEFYTKLSGILKRLRTQE